jgi:hypothetical protein
LSFHSSIIPEFSFSALLKEFPLFERNLLPSFYLYSHVFLLNKINKFYVEWIILGLCPRVRCFLWKISNITS